MPSDWPNASPGFHGEPQCAARAELSPIGHEPLQYVPVKLRFFAWQRPKPSPLPQLGNTLSAHFLPASVARRSCLCAPVLQLACDPVSGSRAMPHYRLSPLTEIALLSLLPFYSLFSFLFFFCL